MWDMQERALYEQTAAAHTCAVLHLSSIKEPQHGAADGVKYDCCIEVRLLH